MFRSVLLYIQKYKGSVLSRRQHFTTLLPTPRLCVSSSMNIDGVVLKSDLEKSTQPCDLLLVSTLISAYIAVVYWMDINVTKQFDNTSA